MDVISSGLYSAGITFGMCGLSGGGNRNSGNGNGNGNGEGPGYGNDDPDPTPDSPEKTKADIVRDNSARGKEFADEMYNELSKQYSGCDSAREVTLVNEDGQRMRADYIVKTGDNDYIIYEFKSSETAPYTTNQKNTFNNLDAGKSVKIVGNNGKVFGADQTLTGGSGAM